MGNPATLNPMRNKTALRLWTSTLVELVVSPERAAWIQKRYPETDTGRPVQFAPPTSSRKKKQKDAPQQSDEGSPETGQDEELAA